MRPGIEHPGLPAIDVSYAARGGGTGGGSFRGRRKNSAKAVCSTKGGGDSNVTARANSHESGLSFGLIAFCFCSVSLPCLTMWQRLHGCFPSKAFSTAAASGASFEKSITIDTHATDCKKAQCPPTEITSRTAISNLAARFRILTQTL